MSLLCFTSLCRFSCLTLSSENEASAKGCQDEEVSRWRSRDRTDKPVPTSPPTRLLPTWQPLSWWSGVIVHPHPRETCQAMQCKYTYSLYIYIHTHIPVWLHVIHIHHTLTNNVLRVRIPWVLLVFFGGDFAPKKTNEDPLEHLSATESPLENAAENPRC